MNHFTAFDVLTPQAKYWCGFIAGDGCVTNGGLSFNVSVCDIGHLEKFVSFVGSRAVPKPIDVHDDRIWGNGKMARVVVCGRILVERMTSLGIVPRKCKVDFSVVESLAMSRDFWRGMIDADGSVYIGINHGKPFPVIGVSAKGRSIIAQFSEYIFKISGYQFSPKLYANWQVAFNGNKARDFIHHIYYDGCVGLDRKLVTAAQCKDWVGIREFNRRTRYLSIRSRIKPGDPYKYSLKKFQDPF